LLAIQVCQTNQQLLNRIGLGMDVTHGCLYIIVAGYVLQCKGIGVFAGFRQKRVPQSVQPGEKNM
jgi:hypothetical protein